MIVTRLLSCRRSFGTSSSQLTSSSAAAAGKLYEDHIPLSALQKAILTVGSGVTAILDPYRHDLVADFGETTGHEALKWMHSKMSADTEGRRVLADKPRLRSDRIDYKHLGELPENTFGYQYSRFYIDNKVSPDTRKIVQFVDDAELAYVMQRYRELHDVVHTILSQPTTIKGEVIVKAFEGVQTRLPLCILGGLIGPVRLSFGELAQYLRRDLPWALRCGRESKFLMSTYFEDRWEQDITELRRELNINLQANH